MGRLRADGITTLAQLARWDGGPDRTLLKLREQAALQLNARDR